MNRTKKQLLGGLTIAFLLLFGVVIGGVLYFNVEMTSSEIKGEVQYRCNNPDCSCHAGGNPSYGDGRTCCSNCKKEIN